MRSSQARWPTVDGGRNETYPSLHPASVRGQHHRLANANLRQFGLGNLGPQLELVFSDHGKQGLASRYDVAQVGVPVDDQSVIRGCDDGLCQLRIQLLHRGRRFFGAGGGELHVLGPATGLGHGVVILRLLDGRLRRRHLVLGRPDRDRVALGLGQPDRRTPAGWRISTQQLSIAASVGDGVVAQAIPQQVALGLAW